MKKSFKEEVFSGKLGEVVLVERRREDGTLRIQQDFSACPTMTEQHTAHLSDLNYLFEKYKPDELAAYVAARSAYRQEILGHDFAAEPSMQDAMNAVVEARRIFEDLDPDVKGQFRNPLEFMKFVDNPANADKLVKFGILTAKEVESVTGSTATQAQPVGASSAGSSVTSAT